MPDPIVIYTDGACSGNPGPGGWGSIVHTPHDARVRELGGGERHTTNNRMEMTAAIRALEAVVDEPAPIELFTDSTYVIHGVTEWVAGWKRRGWKTSSKGDVLNRDLWEKLDALDEARRGERAVQWKYVKGHAGYEGNERCDRIAVAFSVGGGTALYDGPYREYGIDLLKKPPAIARVTGQPVLAKPRASKGSGGPAVYLSYVRGKVQRHSTWASCERAVKGVPNARYRKASSPDEESEILRSWGIAGG